MRLFALKFIGVVATALLLQSCEDEISGPDWGGSGSAAVGEYRIIFSTGDQDTSAIALMNADGSEWRRIVPSGGFRNIFPVISPDGKMVAFQSLRNGAYGIHLINIDGTGERVLVANGATPGWSPDGTRIVFTSHENGTPDIWVINVDGTGKRQLTTSVSQDFNPVWSPDGTMISFVSDRGAGNVDRLYVMNADGAAQRQISGGEYAGTAYHRSSPWSRDSRRIAYTGLAPGSSRQSQVFVVDIDDSTTSVQLTSFAGDGAGNPCWSPDGRSIAFSADDGSRYGIFVIMADGSAQRQLSEPGMPDADNPEWSPDGSRILFLQDGAIMTADAVGSGVRRASVAGPKIDEYPRWSPVRIR